MRQEIEANRHVVACGRYSTRLRAFHCSTDFWAAYQAVIAEEQHTTVGKETRETAHVERWNNTLRQVRLVLRAKRFFLEIALMHIACLNLVLHRFNRERAIMLM